MRAAVIGAQTQVILRLDALKLDVAALDTRISELGQRIEQLERVTQTTGMRAAGAAEEVSLATESAARLAERLAEIERRLGASPAGR